MQISNETLLVGVIALQIPIIVGIVKSLVDANVAKIRADIAAHTVKDNQRRITTLENGTILGPGKVPSVPTMGGGRMATKTGDAIALQAVYGLRDGNFEERPGYCQRFVREVLEHVGGLVKAVSDTYRAATAANTLKRYESDGRYVAWTRGKGEVPELIAGDLLFKDEELDWPDGHVGVFFHNSVMGNSVGCVAENSEFQIKHPDHAIHGAKGWRTLAEFGPFSAVVRIQ